MSLSTTSALAEVVLDQSDGAVNHIWLRTPSGDEHQLSSFATPSQFDQQELRIGHNGISDTGEVMFLNNKKRYIGRPGAAPEEISSDLGHGRWFDGDWYVPLGDTLFRMARAEAPAFLAASPGEAAPVNACLQGDRAAISASPDLTNERHRAFASGETQGKPEG
jgi:hypothetical protein